MLGDESVLFDLHTLFAQIRETPEHETRKKLIFSPSQVFSTTPSTLKFLAKVAHHHFSPLPAGVGVYAPQACSQICGYWHNSQVTKQRRNINIAIYY